MEVIKWECKGEGLCRGVKNRQLLEVRSEEVCRCVRFGSWPLTLFGVTTPRAIGDWSPPPSPTLSSASVFALPSFISLWFTLFHRLPLQMSVYLTLSFSSRSLLFFTCASLSSSTFVPPLDAPICSFSFTSAYPPFTPPPPPSLPQLLGFHFRSILTSYSLSFTYFSYVCF